MRFDPPPPVRLLAGSADPGLRLACLGWLFLTFLSVPGTLHYMEPGEDINWLAQVRRGVAEQCVLALLTTGERYGFELARELRERGQIIASEGTLYPLLARLRRNGLVETSWQESTAGPPRRYYHLTRDGELALASFKKQWRVFSDAVDEILDEGSQE
jgi:PadR family transcriptional regulator